MTHENKRKILSENITKYRLKAGFSKTEMANKVGISYSSYCKIENNITKNPRLKTLLRIATALNIKDSELFDGI